uniref:Major capsid protein L1 n=1 Tax=Eidolon helvum papillomavirus TaxID=1940839 RepID=A0A1P8YVU9_9PAPI|nr:L1 [Eidolon helvum papillomavirus]
MVGCKPPEGEYWAQAMACAGAQHTPGDCPPVELKSVTIEDGDMVDTGFGAMYFKTLQANRSDVPLDISGSICKYPDYLNMLSSPYGDSLFFYLRREQVFARHYFSRAGVIGDAVPDDMLLKGTDGQNQATIDSSVYTATPSGSLVSTDSQLFNRPFWLQRAQGHNNGICWEDQLFITVVDTTRSTNMTLSVASQTEATYKSTNFKQYTRHCEEFDIQLILQLCKIPLDPALLAYLHNMNPEILNRWELGYSNPPPSGSLEDTYRYLGSLATRCPDKPIPPPPLDAFAKLRFWDVDLSEKFSADLDQYPLGRKFLAQAGLTSRRAPRPLSAPSTKRKASSTPARPAKKRKR